MVLCLDIGGTFMRIADISGTKIRGKIVVKTPNSKRKILNQIIELIKRFGNRHIVCISVAGFVKEGKVIVSPNMDLNDTDLKKFLLKKLKIRAYIQNDAKCAALAENYYGYHNYDNFVYITVGTGIGGAILIDNKLYQGHSFAGEFGHMIISGEEFEKSSSGKAFHKIMSKKGKREAFKIIQKNLSQGILNIVYALDPSAIIIGGGYGSEEIDVKKLKKDIYNKDLLKRKLDIKKSSLGSDDSLIGASVLSKIHFRQ